MSNKNTDSRKLVDVILALGIPSHVIQKWLKKENSEEFRKRLMSPTKDDGLKYFLTEPKTIKACSIDRNKFRDKWVNDCLIDYQGGVQVAKFAEIIESGLGQYLLDSEDIEKFVVNVQQAILFAGQFFLGDHGKFIAFVKDSEDYKLFVSKDNYMNEGETIDCKLIPFSENMGMLSPSISIAGETLLLLPEGSVL